MDSEIIMDTCIDYNNEVFDNEAYMERVPFKILIDGEEIVDKDLEQSVLITKMKNTKNKITTACPSPNEFFEALKEKKNNFIVTISDKLSGSHNSAMLAKSMMEERSPETFVHVFDCKNATAGASLIALKLKQLIEEKIQPTEIVEKLNGYINETRTFLLAERLDNLSKNGRISSTKAFVGTLLNISPIMCDNGDGEIILKEQVRGKKKAFNRFIEIIGEEGHDIKNKVLGITHVNAREKAEKLKEEIKSRYDFKDIIIFEAGGLSTIYADDGGIVVSF